MLLREESMARSAIAENQNDREIIRATEMPDGSVKIERAPAGDFSKFSLIARQLASGEFYYVEPPQTWTNTRRQTVATLLSSLAD